MLPLHGRLAIVLLSRIYHSCNVNFYHPLLIPMILRIVIHTAQVMVSLHACVFPHHIFTTLLSSILITVHPSLVPTFCQTHYLMPLSSQHCSISAHQKQGYRVTHIQLPWGSYRKSWLPDTTVDNLQPKSRTCYRDNALISISMCRICSECSESFGITILWRVESDTVLI